MIMKKSIIVIAAAISVTLFSCSDMLEEKNYGKLTVEEIFKNPDNVILYVGQAYADIKWLHDHWGYWGINTLTSDECVNPVRMPGSHWADGGYWADMNTHNWSPNSKAFENLWSKSMSGAILCNKILQTLKDNEALLDPKVFGQFVGELEVLRSYYFFTLFDCFGRIPYVEEFKMVRIPQMEVKDVWRKLVDCLEKNAPNMPVVTDANRAQNYGRVTQGFAYALLARLYLNAASYGVTDKEYYTECIAACDKVISSGSYTIEPNFFTNFKIENKGSKENIFVIVENGSANIDETSDHSMMTKLRITMLSLHYCHQTAWNLIEKPWNGFCAPPNFINKYDDFDLRGTGKGYENDGTNNTGTYGWFIGPVYNAAGTSILKDENGDEAVIVNEITSLIAAGWSEGARMLKYEVDKGKRYKYCENDFVLFRYADVLYMKAEAELRKNGSTTMIGNANFDRIRTRAGVQAYTTLTLDELLNERGREFAWENIRRRDLIRFGKFANGSWDGWGSWRGVKSGAHLNWFPIPRAMLEKAPRENGKSIWTQNPGYDN